MEQRWWNSRTVMVEQWNRDSGTDMVEQCMSDCATEEQLWWNSGK